MKKVKNWLLKDWWLKVLSVILAFIIWFMWVQMEDPTISKDFSNIKVSVLNEGTLDYDSKVYSVLSNSDTVRVTVTAPKSVVNSISSSDILAEADASKINAEGEIPITYSLSNSASYESLVGNHDTLIYSVEDRIRKYVSLVPFYTGEVAENFLFNGVTLDQNMIEVSGPQSAVEQVSYAGITIDVTGASASISANMEIKLYDAGNAELNLSSITKQSESVHVSAEILATKNVVIYASKSGIPANGYLYGKDISISPGMITVAGNSKDLASFSKIVISEPIDISGADSTVEEIVDLNQYLPDDLIFADADFDGLVTVTVAVEPIAEKNVTIPKDNISIINAPVDRNIEITSVLDNIVVTVNGLESDLEPLGAENFSAIIDIEEWMNDSEMEKLDNGAHKVPVKITTLADATVVQNVYVTIVVSDE